MLLTCSFPYVRDWLNEHPFRNEPDARLICNLLTGAPIKADALCTVMKQLRNRYGRKAIYTDGARWYDDACKWLRLKHQIYDTGLKNLMERFVQQI